MTIGEPGLHLFGGVELAARGLGETHIKGTVDSILIAEPPVFHLFSQRLGSGRFGFEEVEGVGDELGGVVVAGAGEFLLDALFEGGVEGERHGWSIPLACVESCGGVEESNSGVPASPTLGPAAAWYPTHPQKRV